MSLSRRDLLRLGSGVGVAAALAGGETAFGAPRASAVAAPLARGTTLDRVLLPGRPGAGGYRPVTSGGGEAHTVRDDLGVPPRSGRGDRRRALLAFAHLSDVHITDVQSPMRVEYLDRYGDGEIGQDLVTSAYRPQELLTAQVAEATVRAVNQAGHGPATGAPLSLALQTGDNADSAQVNEVRWNIDILDGETVRPDSGRPDAFEGVASSDALWYDAHYWHPEGTPGLRRDDHPRTRRGFPEIPGLLDAVRTPFRASGLVVPWYTAFGNHDGLVQGNFPHTLPLTAVAEGRLKLVSPPSGYSQADVIRALGGEYASLLRSLATTAYVRPVTPDTRRRILTRAEIVEEHFATTGAPVGHGFTEHNREAGTAYYTVDRGVVRFVVLDTVNENGQAGGSLDAPQFDWLRGVLRASTSHILVIASHHTIATMDNSLVGTGGSSKRRVLGDEVRALLLQHPQVVAWVNGHTHRNQVQAHRVADRPGGFWEINTASHADWPQQARLIEIADNRDGSLSVFATMLDHDGPDSYGGDLAGPQNLAGLSRELSVNGWQDPTADRRGSAADRNVELVVAAPALAG